MPSLIPQSQPTISQRVRDLFQDDDTYATSLIALVMDRYGADALNWHPTTIRMQLEQDLGMTLPKATFDKIMAAVTVMTTNAFYRELNQFLTICNIMAGDDFDPAVFDPADTAECAWGITEAMMLWPPEVKNPFSEEIVEYVRHVLKSEGYVQAPDVLRIGSDPTQADRIRGDFADDPAMFQSIWQNQQSKADEITDMVKSRMTEMVAELKSLPLRNGNTDKLRMKQP